MIGIKKVQVVPLDINYGKIIDSFNTTDDKTQNAPSINAVEQVIEGVNQDILDTNSALDNLEYDLNTLSSNVYIKDNYAVLEGTITLSSGSATATISYPTGFTYDNAIVISFGTVKSTTTDAFNFGYGDVISYYNSGLINRRITLGASDITLQMDNSVQAGSGSNSYKYKIVLLKYKD